MNKIVIIFILIACSITISAQTETETLPDTSKFLFDIKPTTPINTNFNSLKNPFPTKLTINHNDVFLSLKDTIRQDSLSVLHEQKVNPDLLFVRSAYFTGKSPLFSEIDNRQKIKSGAPIPFEIKQDLRPLVETRYQFNMFTLKWETMIIPCSLKIGNFSIGGMPGGIGISIGILQGKEERMKKRAEKRKKAYVY